MQNDVVNHIKPTAETVYNQPKDAVIVRPTQDHCDDTADREAATPAAVIFVCHRAFKQ
jgi:hypothetical protein